MTRAKGPSCQLSYRRTEIGFMLHRTMTLHRSLASGRFRAEALFRPESVAVIGAASQAGAQVMANLLAGGFKGAILPVTGDASGKGAAISGVLAYPDIESLPLAADLAVLCDDSCDTMATFAALAKRGTFAAVVIGMAEGAAAAAKATGVRVLGPGSFGIAIPGIGLHATRSHLLPRPGKVALISQSAALCRAVLDWAEPNGVGFSHIIGIGGNVDLGFSVALDWLSRDSGTGAILMDIRRIRDRRMFLSGARAASRMRPVVAMSPGGLLRDPSGEADAAFQAALRRAGVLTVDRLEDMLAAAETLTRARPARGDSLAVVTNAIGPGQMAADAALRDGLELTALAPETREVIKLAAPRAFGPANQPGGAGELVYVGTDSPIKLAEAAALLSGAKEVGGVLAVFAPTGEHDETGIAALAACAKSIKAPLLACVMGETTGAAYRRTLAEAGVPAFATPEQAVRGFHHLVENRHNAAAARELPPSDVLTIAPDKARVRRIFNTVRAAGRSALMQDEALDALDAYGISTVPSRAAQNTEEMIEAAEAMGYPVVIKRRRCTRPEPLVRSAAIADIVEPSQLRDAARLVANAPDGFLVQHQVAQARELRIQARDDDTFGPAITFGQGGTAARLYRDAAVDLPPLNLPLAHAMIARTRISRVLGNAADRRVASEDAVADALVRVSQLIVDFPEIDEIDIDPLLSGPDHAKAADAWIALRAADAPASPLALPPYPTELIGRYSAKGQNFVIRPIRPEDAQAHGAFFSRLTPEDIRYRFFSALRALTPEQMARMTQVDYDREMAFIATRQDADGHEDTVGVSRLVRDAPEHGEFAVIVQPDTKGTGLASHLMKRLLDWGRSQGMREVVGQVLSDNRPMLSFIRKLGFTIHPVPGEPDIVEAKFDMAKLQ
jgi:acetyltransferase